MQQKVREGNSHNDFMADVVQDCEEEDMGYFVESTDVGGSGVPLTAAAFSAFAFADSALRGERLLELPPTHAFQALE